MESNSVVKTQHRKICLWCEEECYAESGIPADSSTISQGVAKHNNFKDLATYAFTCLITHASNVVAEGRFSSVTAIKTTPCKKAQIKLLDALLRIRSHLLSNAMCCKDIQSTANMIKLPNNVDPMVKMKAPP